MAVCMYAYISHVNNIHRCAITDQRTSILLLYFVLFRVDDDGSRCDNFIGNKLQFREKNRDGSRIGGRKKKPESKANVFHILPTAHDNVYSILL